ncbi:MAG: MgtC/SapB family protein [Acidobacteriota bacterium]
MSSVELPSLALRLGVAALGALAVGVEREWSARARGRDHDFAGVRTFLLLGLLGGLAAELVVAEVPWAGVALLAAAVSLAVIAYAIDAQKGNTDSTTEVAALVVLAAGFLSGLGNLTVASAVCALTALVLVEKGRIHAAVYKLRSEEIEAGLRFAVLAVVVLPLLPVGPFGPEPGLRPRELWALVLAFSGLSFAGYVGLRAVGPERGYGLVGLLGGLISSTAVTLQSARQSRKEPELGVALALGVIAANTVMPARVLAISAVLNLEVARRAAPFLLTPLALGALLVLLLLRRAKRGAAGASQVGNPLRLGSAIQMAVLFQVVLWVLAWAGRRFGSAGLLSSSALLGLTDVDALTYSACRLGMSPERLPDAVSALGIGLLANTALKTALAAVLARGRLRWIASTALLALGIALGVALLVT